MKRQIKLYDVSEEHLTQKYVRWLNDPEVNRFLEIRHEHHDLQGIKNYFNALKKESSYFWKAIHFIENNEHIGNIKCKINKYDIGEISIFIGNKAFWGKGIAKEAILEISRLAFNEGLIKLIAYIYSSNEGSFRSFEGAGYFRECTLSKEVLDGNKRIDVYRYAKYSPNYKRS